jgi:hypothetical protein
MASGPKAFATTLKPNSKRTTNASNPSPILSDCGVSCSRPKRHELGERVMFARNSDAQTLPFAEFESS